MKIYIFLLLFIFSIIHLFYISFLKTGKVFSLEELQKFAAILKRNPHVIAICDEVYEYLVFSPKCHTRLASLPDMWDRVITVSSSGKTFSVTGWKVGWAIGPENLVHPITLGIELYYII